MTKVNATQPAFAFPRTDPSRRSGREALDHEAILDELTSPFLTDHDFIAVVGIGCRLPRSIHGAQSYWDFLTTGKSAISEVPPSRFGLAAFYDSNPDALGRSITKWGGFLEDVQGFDASLFEISPREALGMDPQQRILLEVVEEALEDADLTRRDVQRETTGVFIGISASDYGLIQRTPFAGNETYAGTGSALSIAANRISHRFNLNGPSFSVDTACSSSLVALDSAVNSLREGRCSLAISGGANILADPGAFVAFSKAGMLSPTGTISTFDRRANGYVRGEGVGVVVLRRLSEALAAGDRIYATIRATCVNQDGRTVTLTSPSEAAQRAMLAELCRRGQVTPESVDYVEAHGTGTPVGDPIEASAIGSVFGQVRDSAPLLVGSVKPVIGHLEAAAGISGFIKGVLVAHHRQVPPNANFADPNPAIPFDALNIRVPTQLTDIAFDRERSLVVVNSFGFGGTNASALIEGFPQQTGRTVGSAPTTVVRPLPIPLSGATDLSLRLGAERLADAIETGALADGSLADIAASLGQHRTPFGKRRVVVASSRDEAAARLREVADNRVPPAVRGQLSQHVAGSPRRQPRLAFTFAGQGSQWWGMARRLLHEDDAFRSAFYRFDEMFSDLSGWSIRDELLKDKATSQVGRGLIAQPGIFGVQVALAAYWKARGVEPEIVVGHSFGEIAAAHVAGALDLDTATRIISTRSRVREHVPAGSMMVVPLSAQDFTTLVGTDLVDIAAFNGPATIAVSGPMEALEEVEKRLAETAPNVAVRRLQSDCAWHSRLIDGVEGWFREAVGAVSFRSPSVTFVSTVTGYPQTVFDIDYWWQNLRQPVRYDAAVATAIALGTDAFLELSPHRVLSGLTAGIAADRSASVTIVNSLLREEDDFASLAVAAGELHCAGVQLDWPAVTGGTPIKGSLPTYAWDRQPYWHDSEEARATLFDGKVHPLLGTRQRGPDCSWTNAFTLSSDRYLSGHAVEGETIFPAAGYLEMMLAAGRDALGDGAIELTNVRFLAALFVRADDTIVMTTTYDTRTGLVQISSRIRDDSAAWTVRAHAHLRLTDSVLRTELHAPASTELRWDRAAFYKETEQHGLHYDGIFQSAAEVAAGAETAVGVVQASPEAIAGLSGFLAHPGLLDSAFQMVVAIGHGNPARDPHSLSLPVGVKQLRFCGTPLPTRFDVIAALREGQTKREHSADYALLDESGVPLLTVDGLELRDVERQHDAAEDKTSARHLLETFVETSLSLATADTLAGTDWLIVADPNPAAFALADTLAAHGAVSRVLSIESALDFGSADLIEAARASVASGASRYGFVFAAPLLLEALDDGLTGSQTAALVERLSSALVGLGRSLNTLKDEGILPELVVLTDRARPVAETTPMELGSLIGSSMVGLTRTIANECPAHRVKSIDCPSALDAAQLVAAIADVGNETEWILREGATLVPRLQSLEADELPRPEVLVDPQREPVNVAVTMNAPGSLTGLMLERTVRPKPGPGQVLVRTSAVGLNFRDVMAATGLLPAEAEPDPAWLHLGLEYSGVVDAVGEGVTSVGAGDRLMGLGRHCLQAYQLADAATVIPLPANISDAEAATVPSAFSTAQYALRHVARLRRGERILIHLGTGGVGLAAIQIARNIGAEIFATAGSESKREYLKAMGIAHVMPSRSLRFADEVMTATRGEGLDVILNSLPGTYIEKGVELLRPFGRFVEIGKRDVYADTPIGMRSLRTNISFTVVDLAAMAKDRPDLLSQVLTEVADALASGELKPLPLHAFDVGRSRDAFRYMSQARHIGKVVIEFTGEAVSVTGAAGSAFTARRDGNYLITGGLRGFGLSVADWLSANGAGEVTLASRSGLIEPGTEPLLDAIRARGTLVSICSLDVTDDTAVDTRIAELAAGPRALAGVVHGAAVFDDAFLGQLTRDRIAAVIAPKVAGGWNLHRALERSSVAVDFFVSFSSIAQVIGSIGQANYVAANAFLDGLAFYRRSHGRPGLTIDWGALGDSGFVARSESLGRYLESMGIQPLANGEAFDGLREGLSSGIASSAYARIDWARLTRALGESAASARLSSVASGRREATHKIQSDLAAVPQSEWLPIVSEFIVDEVAAVLGVDKQEITPARALTELGFDSLSSIELKNRLESQLGLSFTVGAFLQAKTLGDLAELVVDLLIQAEKAKRTSIETGGSEEAAERSAAGSDDYVPSAAQLRNLSLSTAHMTSKEGRMALERAATLELQSDRDAAALETAWERLCERHPLLRLHLEDGGLRLGEPRIPAMAVDAASAAATGLDLAAGELVRATIQVEPGAAVLGLRLHGSVADEHGLALALTDWAALAAGAPLSDAPAPSRVLAELAGRHPGVDSEGSVADLAYWRAMANPWTPAMDLPSRRLAPAPLGMGLNRGPSAQLRLNLRLSADRADEASLLAAFALALARRAKVPSVIIERHFELPLPGSVGPWTESMPVLLHDATVTLQVACQRISRQLNVGSNHTRLGLAACEIQFADAIKEAGSLPGQFGFRFDAIGRQDDAVRFAPSSSGLHDICLEVTSRENGLSIGLSFDTMAVGEEYARAVLEEMASIAAAGVEHNSAVASIQRVDAVVGTRRYAPDRGRTLQRAPETPGRGTTPQSSPVSPAILAAGNSSVAYPVLASTRAIMSVLRRPETTRTFIGNWNVNQALLVRPGIDVVRLQAALASLVARHETLRTHYRMVGDHLLAIVDERYPGKLGVQDLGEPTRDQMMAAIDLVSQQPFDLTRGPLFELHLLKCGKMGDVVIIHLCEFIADGWSMALIVDELVRHYFGLGVAGGGTSYAELLKSSALPGDPDERAALDAYWEGVMGRPAPLPRFGRVAKGYPPAVPGAQAPFQRRSLQVNQAGVNLLRKRGAALGVNENSLWAAAIMGAAGRQAGAETAYFAAIHSMRNSPALRDKVGLLAGRLPVRCDLADAGGFEGLARQVHARATTNNEHAYPGLEFRPPLTMPDGTPTAQAEWTLWAYGRVLPEQFVRDSLASTLVGTTRGAVIQILNFKIESLPTLPYGFTRGDFALRPMTNKQGIELNFYHDLLSLTPIEARGLLEAALGDVGLQPRHISGEEVSPTIGAPEDIDRLNRGLPPEAHPFDTRVG